MKLSFSMFNSIKYNVFLALKIINYKLAIVHNNKEIPIEKKSNSAKMWILDHKNYNYYFESEKI